MQSPPTRGRAMTPCVRCNTDIPLRRPSFTLDGGAHLFVSRTYDLLDNGIKRVAARTLNTQEMPVSAWGFHFTVIAHNVNNSLQIGWHGLFCNIARPGLPRSRHGLLRDDSLLANGTAIVKASELAEAMSVNSVAAWQILWRLAR
jgi:hypothetical protein